MNLSFFGALVRGFIFAALITSGAYYRDRPLPGLGLGLLVAYLYVRWVFHNTPTRNKTAVRFFSAARVRAGPLGKGLVEGWNGPLFGRPIYVLEDKSVLEQTHRFAQMLAYSNDRVPVKLDGTFNSFIDDVYSTYNISDADAIEGTESTVLKHIRAKVEDFSAEELVSQEKGKPSAKLLLATRVYEAAHAELTSSDAQWGRDITKALQINHIKLDPEFETALRKRQQEIIEGQYEKTQIERRIEQITMLTKAGVPRDLAGALAQAETEKKGVTVHTVNIPGMQGIGEAASKFAETMTDWIKTKTGGTP